MIKQLTTERLLSLLVQVGDSNSGSKDCIVRVFGSERGSNLSGQVVQLHGGHTSVQPVDNFQCDRRLQEL